MHSVPGEITSKVGQKGCKFLSRAVSVSQAFFTIEHCFSEMLEIAKQRCLEMILRLVRSSNSSNEFHLLSSHCFVVLTFGIIIQIISFDNW